MSTPSEITAAESAVKADVTKVESTVKSTIATDEAKVKAFVATEETKTVKLTTAIIVGVAAFIVGLIVAHL